MRILPAMLAALSLLAAYPAASQAPAPYTDLPGTAWMVVEWAGARSPTMAKYYSAFAAMRAASRFEVPAKWCEANTGTRQARTQSSTRHFAVRGSPAATRAL